MYGGRIYKLNGISNKDDIHNSVVRFYYEDIRKMNALNVNSTISTIHKGEAIPADY